MTGDDSGMLLLVPESDLFEVYSLLADATDAAATGDPNRCASLASDAKEKVVEVRNEADQVAGGGE
jgi:hypothetical protein